MQNRLTDRVVSSRVIIQTPEPKHGMAQYVAELVIALAKVGVPVTLFCPANFEHLAKVYAAGAKVVIAPCRETAPAGLAARILRNLRFAAKTALLQFRLVRRGDIVHFQSTLHLPLGLVFYLLVILRGGSIVVTAHDPLPHRWRFPRGLRWLERRMLQLSYRLSDRIIVHNETGREVLIQQFRQDASHVRVIPHGAYSTGEVHKPAYPPFDSLRLLAFGSIRENKGLHLAIGAVQMAASASSIPVRLTIAGGIHNAAEEQYWHRCQKLIAAKPDGIEVIARHIENDEVGPLLAEHHAVLLPYVEFFSESGVANLALSHDRPILATAAGGAGELIEQSVCGIPIAAPSVEAVATAISLAMHFGPERLRKMGLAGGEFIRKTRSWDSIAQQTAELYTKMANIHVDIPPKEVDVFAAD